MRNYYYNGNFPPCTGLLFIHWEQKETILEKPELCRSLILSNSLFFKPLDRFSYCIGHMTMILWVRFPVAYFFTSIFFCRTILV